MSILAFIDIPYRLTKYTLNRTSSRIVRVTAASGLAQEFQMVTPQKIVRGRTFQVAFLKPMFSAVLHNFVHCAVGTS